MSRYDPRGEARHTAFDRVEELLLRHQLAFVGVGPVEEFFLARIARRQFGNGEGACRNPLGRIWREEVWGDVDVVVEIQRD